MLLTGITLFASVVMTPTFVEQESGFFIIKFQNFLGGMRLVPLRIPLTLPLYKC